ncbi:MAG: hypothetical protein HC877_04415 [Thioploca sp.]|nr:hypothetical protein [Thioploca sp.]
MKEPAQYPKEQVTFFRRSPEKNRFVPLKEQTPSPSAIYSSARKVINKVTSSVLLS